MASADEVNSTLKNLVSNVGLLANSTAVANALTVIDTSLNAIATALTTSHSFGGSVIFTINAVSAVISDPRIAGVNAKIAFSPGNFSAAVMAANQLVFVDTIVAGAATLEVHTGSATTGTEQFYYVGYNP